MYFMYTAFSPKKSRILSHNVHNVGGNNGFVVFSFLLFTHSQQIFDDCHQEPLLILFMHRTRNRANSPT